MRTRPSPRFVKPPFRRVRDRFTPRSIPGLRWWLDGLRVPGVGVGSDVGRWADLSGRGPDVTQSTTSQKPTRTAKGVQFDGADDIMNGVPREGSLRYGSLVLQLSSASNGNIIRLSLPGTSFSFRLRVTNSGQNIRLETHTGTSQPSITAVDVLTPLTPTLVSWAASGSGATLWINGVEEASSDDNFNTFNDWQESRVIMEDLPGVLSEIVTFDHIPSDLSVARLNQYLARRHGVTLA